MEDRNVWKFWVNILAIVITNVEDPETIQQVLNGNHILYLVFCSPLVYASPTSNSEVRAR